ncbi:MAG: NAD-dependent epimerase/dehydratase family protein [Nitrospirota bacterium]
MNVLILGGSSFIGYHLTNALRDKNIEPMVVDIRKPLLDVKYAVIDLQTITPDSLLFRGVDVVYHLAWTTLPKTSNENPIYDVTSNLTMTLRILDACIRNGVKKVVFISSGGTVYGIPKNVPIKETHPTNPICSYGITKLIAEKYLQMYYHIHGLEYIVFRPSNPFGEYQNPSGIQGAVTVFLGNIAADKPITIWGDGTVIRDYFYIADLADAMVKALDYQPAKDSQRIFNVGSGRGISLNALLDIISDITGYNPKVEYSEGRVIDVPENVLDITLISDRLGWKPETDLMAGIEKTWLWVNKYLRAVY